MGGENASLAVPYKQQKDFANAGYTNITINSTYSGGLVRQHGNFSFSRVYESGHEVPAYQPETAYQIFQRAIFGNDVATGNTSVSDDYSTQGPSDTMNVKNQLPKQQVGQCYILSPGTCTPDQYESVLNGKGLVHDYILIDSNWTNLFPGVGNNNTPTSTSSGGPGSTSTPTSSGSGSSSTTTGAAVALNANNGALGSAVGLGLLGWLLL